VSLAVSRDVARQKRHQRIRLVISGTAERPRLAVYRSSQHIYAQLIDDARGHTLAAASTLDQGLRGAGSKSDSAKAVGRLLAERAKKAKVTQAVFDRGGYRFHGRVRALAEGAREAGLDF
jgi:large subunit ribosomal protein L18